MQMTHPKLDVALERLWRQSRFVSYFFQSVQFVREDAVPTLALTVSRSRAVLLYHDAFLDRIGTDELLGLLVHEMLHVVLAHDHRAFPGEDLRLQNLAQDMVINSHLAAHRTAFFSRRGDYEARVPRLTLPRGLPEVPAAFQRETGVLDPSWEELFRWLKKQPPASIGGQLEEARGSWSLPGGTWSGVEREGGDRGPGPLSLPAEEIPTLGFSLGPVQGLAFCNRDQEVLPAGVHLFHAARDLEDLKAQRDRVLLLASGDHECLEERSFQEIRGMIERASPADISSWKRRLASIVDFSSQSHEWLTTSSRRSRRSFGAGLCSPGRRFREQTLITVAVDVSASMVMRPEVIEAAFGAIEELLGKYRVNLVCIDEKLFVPGKRGGRLVAAGDRRPACFYRRGDWKALETGASGTTFFAPLFNDYLRGHRELLLVMTDGQIYDLHRLRRYVPTVWVVPEDGKESFSPPFGRTVTLRPRRVGA